MSLYLKIILIIFGLAYLISPMDLIPEIFVPYIGWIDDTLILGVIIYLIRHNRLPDFSFFKKEFKHSETPKYKSKKENQTQQPKTPYEILGIFPDASKKEIQDAYKEAIKKYHPDKLSHLGNEFADLANAKFIEIQTAYDTLMKK